MTLFDGGCPVSNWLWRPTFEMWFAHERSRLIVRLGSSNDILIKKIVKKVDRRVCQTILSERERDGESVRCVRIERHIPSA